MTKNLPANKNQAIQRITDQQNMLIGSFKEDTTLSKKQEKKLEKYVEKDAENIFDISMATVAVEPGATKEDLLPKVLKKLSKNAKTRFIRKLSKKALKKVEEEGLN